MSIFFGISLHLKPAPKIALLRSFTIFSETGHQENPHKRPKLFHGVSTHPSIRGRPARVGCRCNFGAKHRVERDAAMEMNVRDRRWPGWTVDESCSFSTKVGDPSFLPTNVDTLTLFDFFFGEDQTPPKFHGIPAKTEKNTWSCRFETFLEGSFGWKNFRPTFDWLKFTQPLPILFRSSVEQFFRVSKYEQYHHFPTLKQHRGY